MDNRSGYGPILIVEDSIEDYEAMCRSLNRMQLRRPILHCEDGDEAVDYLQQLIAPNETVCPLIPVFIFLDLNLPGTHGLEILEMLKQEKQLKTIPVCVLTTSRSPEDVEQAYQLGANSYLQKPVEPRQFQECIEQSAGFWMEQVVLPNEK